jgi:hypothetical protein
LQAFAARGVRVLELAAALLHRTTSATLPSAVVTLESLVIVLAPPAVVLYLYVLGLDPVAFTARATGCYELPANIHAADELRDPIAQLLARSSTLRGQCARIAAARRTQVTVNVSMASMDGQARARSTARRYHSGLLIVDIEIPPASPDFAELLAHEFEHVTEFIDRVDFKTLARTRGGPGVERRPDGSFESDRARRAGRAAAAEAATATDPAVTAVGHGMATGVRATLGLARRSPR